jgi:hypothetical protein
MAAAATQAETSGAGRETAIIRGATAAPGEAFSRKPVLPRDVFSRVVLPQASGIETWSQSGTASSIFLPL